jgi:large subunit ribosomal protein L24e
MPRCSFSGKEIPKGQGLMYVKKDGTILYFYSSKEKKNYLDLGREGRRQKWTPSAREFKARQAVKAAAPKAEEKKAPAKPAPKPAEQHKPEHKAPEHKPAEKK